MQGVGASTHVLDNHDQEGQLNSERLVLVGGARDVVSRHIGAHDLKDARLDVLVGDAFDVAIADLLVPDLQWLAANAVQDGQEARLEGVLEHAGCGCSCSTGWRGGTRDEVRLRGALAIPVDRG